MKRVVSVVSALVIAFVAFAAPAQAWDSGNSDGTQPVIAGDNVTNCAVRDTGVVYCWGWNTSGQLGRGNTTPSTAVAPVVTGFQTSALSVSVGGATVCAVIVDRTVQCWGAANQGKIGNGAAPANVTTPTTVPGLSKVATVQVGTDVVCAVKQDGTVWCWGFANWAGFTGFPSTQQNSPVQVTGLSNIVDVSQDDSHACALRVDHRVLCWGNNSMGQFGDGTTDPHSGVVLVPGITDAVAVTVGSGTSCVIRSGGSVYCWGNNYNGSLGSHSSAAFSPDPQPVYGLNGVKSLGQAPFGACAVTGSLVKCWGSGSYGRLGDGQTADAYAPTRAAAAALGSPTSVMSSYWNSCEIGDGGRVWCWGSQNGGQLGAGSAADPPAGTGTGPGNTFGYAADRTKVTLLNSAPGKPTGTSTATKKIRVTWAAPSTSSGASAPKDYVIQYRLKGATAWKTFADPVTTTRSATITGLTSGKYYQVRVLPKNWAGTGEASAASGYIKSK